MKRVKALNIVIFVLLLLSIPIAIYSIYNWKKSQESNASATKPISGTFIFIDSTVEDMGNLTAMYTEMKNMGIDTVIYLTGTSYVQKPNCNVGTYVEKYYIDTTAHKNHFKVASNLGFNIYLASSVTTSGCIDYTKGSVNDKNSDKGRMISATINGWNKTKQYFISQGLNTTLLKGVYDYEVDASTIKNVAVKSYYTDSASTIHSKLGVKVLISPYKWEKMDYNTIKAYFDTFYSTGIDIIAPQDSMGTLKVTSYQTDVSQYQALAASALQHNKIAWANVETFYQPTDNGKYTPTTIDKLKQQISSANQSGISKIITWLYPHTMLTTPAFDTVYSWTNQYSASNAVKRYDLNARYSELYITKEFQIQNEFIYGNNIVLKGSGLKDKITGQIKYVKTNGSVGYYDFSADVHKEDLQTVYISVSSIPGIDTRKPFGVKILTVENKPLVTLPTSSNIVNYTPQFVFIWGGNLVIKGNNLGGEGSTVKVKINQGTNNYSGNIKVFKEDMEVIYVSLSQLTNFKVGELTASNISVQKSN